MNTLFLVTIMVCINGIISLLLGSLSQKGKANYSISWGIAGLGGLLLILTFLLTLLESSSSLWLAIVILQGLLFCIYAIFYTERCVYSSTKRDKAIMLFLHFCSILLFVRGSYRLLVILHLFANDFDNIIQIATLLLATLLNAFPAFFFVRKKSRRVESVNNVV